MRLEPQGSVLTARLTRLVVGQMPSRGAEECFNCGGKVTLGRMSATVAGKKVISCFRAECAEALKNALNAAHGGSDAET